MLKTKNKKFFMYPDHHGHTQLLKMPEVENEMDNIWPYNDLKNGKTNIAKYSMHIPKKLVR
jgi:hypothetical protein